MGCNSYEHSCLGRVGFKCMAGIFSLFAKHDCMRIVWSAVAVHFFSSLAIFSCRSAQVRKWALAGGDPSLREVTGTAEVSVEATAIILIEFALILPADPRDGTPVIPGAGEGRNEQKAGNRLSLF